MAFALVDEAYGGVGSPSNFIATMTSSVGATNLFAILVWFQGPNGGTPEMADLYSNTWTRVGRQGGNRVVIDLWLVNSGSPNTGAAHTFTEGGGGGNGQAGIAAYAYSGGTGGSLGFVSADNSGGSTGQPGSLTPTAADSLIFSGCVAGANFSSIDSGFSARAGGFTPGILCKGASLIPGSTSAVNPTWTLTGSSGDFATFQYEFLAAGGGGGSTTKSRLSYLGAGYRDKHKYDPRRRIFVPSRFLGEENAA